MRLLIVRHGPAESRDPRRWSNDDLRPLSRDGRRETRDAAAGIAALERQVGTILTSPATRARATAEILRNTLGVRSKLIDWPELAPGAPAAPLLERLAEDGTRRATVLLVGHEPQLGELVGLAIAGDAVSVTRLGRAGTAAVEFPKAIRAGGGTLAWRLDRKALTRVGRRL
ncbi:MAG: histidine phosphatase family protein [Thermoplasmata archaeon]|nr:histidine phosphatase family protein [Thermoplasmata archaeon]